MLILIALGLSGCGVVAGAVTGVASEVVSKIIPWKDAVFLNIPNMGKVTWIPRAIGGICIVLYLAIDKDDSSWGNGFLILGVLALTPWMAEILKTLGQLFWPDYLSPAWLQKTSGYDAASSLGLTVVWPLVHMVVEGSVVFALVTGILAAAMGNSPFSILWGISMMIGWIITPHLYAFGAEIVGGIGDLDGLMGVVIDVTTSRASFYNWMTVISWIIGYIGLPILVAVNAKRQIRKRIAEERAEEKKEEKEKVEHKRQKLSLTQLEILAAGGFAATSIFTKPDAGAVTGPTGPVDGYYTPDPGPGWRPPSGSSSGPATKRGNSGSYGPIPMPDRWDRPALPAQTRGEERRGLVEDHILNYHDDRLREQQRAANAPPGPDDPIIIKTGRNSADDSSAPPETMNDQEFNTRFGGTDAGEQTGPTPPEKNPDTPPETMSDEKFHEKFPKKNGKKGGQG